jgi:hypothetical protein
MYLCLPQYITESVSQATGARITRAVFAQIQIVIRSQRDRCTRTASPASSFHALLETVVRYHPTSYRMKYDRNARLLNCRLRCAVVASTWVLDAVRCDATLANPCLFAP